MPKNRDLGSDACFAALIALALAMKALVPAGWMPVFENGTVSLRLCGGWAAVPAERSAEQTHHAKSMEHAAAASSTHHDHHEKQDASAASAHHDGREEQQQNSNQPCSFAAAGLSWTALEPAGMAELPLQGSTSARSFPRAVAVGRGLAAPPPPSTGPPILT